MNDYFMNEPTIISFSGGRSSGYMLHKILEAHGGLPEHIKVYFANTGKEMEQTLEFVRDCEVHWNCPITWVELGGDECEIKRVGDKHTYGTKVVNFDTASRNGEPFAQLINMRSYPPNPVARFCTAELKIRRIQDHQKTLDMEFDQHAIGIRFDEPRRWSKMLSQPRADGHERVLPMVHAQVTKEMVGDFWKAQPFDLNLPNNQGVTDWGNCDLCMLKGRKKRISIIKQRPELADWWIKQEEKSGSTFRKEQGESYKNLKRIALENEELFDPLPDITLGCYCGD